MNPGRTRCHGTASTLSVLLFLEQLDELARPLPETRIGLSALSGATSIGVLVLVRDRTQWGCVILWRNLTVDRLLFLHRDALGSITAATNASAQVVYQNRYKAFGQRSLSGLASGYIQSRLSYTSRESSVGDLYNYRSRYYSAGTGRFLSQDGYQGSEVSPPSLHRYAYVYNNPIKYTDPTGELPQLVGLLVLLVLTIVLAAVLFAAFFTPYRLPGESFGACFARSLGPLWRSFLSWLSYVRQSAANVMFTATAIFLLSLAGGQAEAAGAAVVALIILITLAVVITVGFLVVQLVWVGASAGRCAVPA